MPDAKYFLAQAKDAFERAARSTSESDRATWRKIAEECLDEAKALSLNDTKAEDDTTEH